MTVVYILEWFDIPYYISDISRRGAVCVVERGGYIDQSSTLLSGKWTEMDFIGELPPPPSSFKRGPITSDILAAVSPQPALPSVTHT